MQQELALIDQAVEFVCPRCGASAFEVTGTDSQINPDEEAASDTMSFISMTCLCCLHTYHREIHGYTPQ